MTPGLYSCLSHSETKADPVIMSPERARETNSLARAAATRNKNPKKIKLAHYLNPIKHAENTPNMLLAFLTHIHGRATTPDAARAIAVAHKVETFLAKYHHQPTTSTHHQVLLAVVVTSLITPRNTDGDICTNIRHGGNMTRPS